MPVCPCDLCSALPLLLVATQVLDYSKSDTFATGLVAHEIMAGEPDHTFPSDDPKSWRDADYTDVEPER